MMMTDKNVIKSWLICAETVLTTTSSERLETLAQYLIDHNDYP